MAAKLVILLLVVALVVSVATIAAFWYLNQRAEMEHELTKEEKRRQAEREKELWDE